MYLIVHIIFIVIFQIKDEVQKNKQEYTKCVDKVRIERAKYEDANAKGESVLKFSVDI